jgi:hypothetical protein
MDNDDPERIARLLAHAIARTADRLPIMQRLSRHLEGREAKAGLGSDLISGALELYNRNQEQVNNLLKEYGQNVARSKAARPARDKQRRSRRSRKAPESPAQPPQEVTQ